MKNNLYTKMYVNDDNIILTVDYQIILVRIVFCALNVKTREFTIDLYRFNAASMLLHDITLSAGITTHDN